MIDPIPALLPIPAVPFETGKPHWLTEPPKLFFINARLAITLSEIRWRNRNGYNRWVPPGLPHDGGSYQPPASWIWDRWDIRDRQTFALHDFTYAAYDHVRSWPVTRREADFDLVDGLRLSTTGGARTRYIFIKLLGEPVWRNKPKDELTEKWFKAVAAGKLDQFTKEVTNT